MKSYPENSPQAMARVIAMMMVTDGEVHATELAFLDQRNVFATLGISRAEFKAVAQDYCGELIRANTDPDGIALIDPERIDRILAEVTDPRRQKIVCMHALGIVAADGDISGHEKAVLRYVLAMWGFDADRFVDPQ